jgi:hypothetical protein
MGPKNNQAWGILGNGAGYGSWLGYGSDPWVYGHIHKEFLLVFSSFSSWFLSLTSPSLSLAADQRRRQPPSSPASIKLPTRWSAGGATVSESKLRRFLKQTPFSTLFFPPLFKNPVKSSKKQTQQSRSTLYKSNSNHFSPLTVFKRNRTHYNAHTR